MSVWQPESQVYQGKDCKVTLIAIQPKPRCIVHAVWKIFKSGVDYPFCCWSIALMGMAQLVSTEEGTHW